MLVFAQTNATINYSVCKELRKNFHAAQARHASAKAARQTQARGE
jgi:hypothetical protein